MTDQLRRRLGDQTMLVKLARISLEKIAGVDGLDPDCGVLTDEAADCLNRLDAFTPSCVCHHPLSHHNVRPGCDLPECDCFGFVDAPGYIDVGGVTLRGENRE